LRSLAFRSQDFAEFAALELHRKAAEFTIELRTAKKMHRGGGSLVRLPD